jgi:hypothetical protein
MLACLAALLTFRSVTAPVNLAASQVDADITASLIRDDKGQWLVKLVGPANPSDWNADADGLQLSLVGVGDEPAEQHPSLTFVNPSVGVQGALVKEKAESEAVIPVTPTTGSHSPGFVRLRASGFVLSTDPVSHKMISLPVHGNEDLVYLPASLDAPKLETGLRFLYLPIRALDLKQEDGAVVPFDKGELHELRLESIDTHADGTFQCHFRMEGWDKPLTLDGSGDPLQIPGLPPVLWDETLRGLRQKYLNKLAWVYGGSLSSVSTMPDEWASVRIGVVQPVVIRKILRLYTHNVMLNVGPQIAALGGATRSSFYTDCPIYVLADIGDRGKVTAATGSSSDDMSKMLMRTVKLSGFQIVADEWQFERTFSLKSGIGQHPDWPTEMTQAVVDGKIRKGMSHAMVAWTLGWPCEPASKKTMLSLATWRYDIVKPYSYWVEFVDDKVVKFGEDGGKPTHKS